MQLEDFFDYKNRLMEELVTNEKIVRLLNDHIKMKDAHELAYTQIFPSDYVPETVQNGDTYICFDVDVQSVSNKTFLTPVLYIWVFVHRSKMRLPEGGVRSDKICSEICKQINGSRYYGLGQLNLFSVKRFAPMTDYIGKVMTFYAKEFNRQHEYDAKRSVPANRKDPDPVKRPDCEEDKHCHDHHKEHHSHVEHDNYSDGEYSGEESGEENYDT